MSTEEIFAKAIQLEPSQRAKFLIEVCRGDEAKRERIEELLLANERTNSLLDAVPSDDSLASTTEALSKGKHPIIGNYKLLHKLGEGGFGVVYMAEQLEPVRRKVALKIVKTERLGDASATIARFEAERQALAMMDHPNIAKVFDGGAIPAGTDLLAETLEVADRPFFVMELVNGVPVTEYCDKNNLPNRERLELFITVCQAVQHAHQKGVIHRDLKPSNILVTLHDGKPVVKVIDFGVAKAINQQLTDKTLYTVLGDMIGTPLYMSPEQAERSGLDIDTRSDIYSLGVLLYELLTGTTPLTPQELKEAGILQIQKRILESEPPKPSTRLSTSGSELTVIAKHRSITPDKLSRELKGDLDWIVMKALDKDRSRRYDTAKGFANDVERFLNDDAVSARPPNVIYQLRKFAKRNLAAIVIVGVVGMSLVLATLVSSQFAIVATRAHAEAERLSKIAEQEQQSAIKAAHDANALRLKGEKQIKELRRANYARNIQAGFQAWERGSLARMRQLLEECSPVQSQSDLRGFEWRILKALYDSNDAEKSIQLDEVPYDAEFTPSGTGIILLLGDGKLAYVDLQAHVDLQARSVSIIDTGLSRFRSLGGRQLLDFLSEEEFIVAGKSAKRHDSGLLVRCRVEPTGGRVAAIETHELPFSMHSICATANGNVLVSSGSENSTYTYSLNQRSIVEPRLQGIRAIVGDSVLVTCSVGDWSEGQFLYIYDKETYRLEKVVPTGTQPRALEITPAGTLLFSDSGGLWEISLNKEEERRRISWERMHHLCSVGNSYWAMSGLDNNSVRLVDRSNNEELSRYLHTARITKLICSKDGNRTASTDKDGLLKVKDLTLPLRRKYSGFPAWYCPNAIGPGIVAHQTGLAEITIERQNGKELTFSFDDPVWQLSFSPDSKWLTVVTRKEGRLFLCEIDSCEIKEIDTNVDHAFFSESDQLFTFSEGRAQVYRLDEQSRLVVIERFECGLIRDAAYDSKNGILVMADSAQGLIHIRDMKSGKGQQLAAPGVISVDIDPNHALIAACNREDTCKIFDAKNGTLLHQLSGNGNWITDAAFSKGGKTLASVSPMGEMKFWRMPSGEEAGSLMLREGLRKVHFLAAGNGVAWASMDGDLGLLPAVSVP